MEQKQRALRDQEAMKVLMMNGNLLLSKEWHQKTTIREKEMLFFKN